MKRFLVFLPYALIVCLYLLIPHILSIYSGVQVESYNRFSEGARILAWRKDLLEGKFSRNCDIYFAGTSRTAAGFDPREFARQLKLTLTLENEPCGLNLGNLANSPDYFLKTLGADDQFPRLLVMEFNPIVFYRSIVAPARDNYTEHQNAVLMTDLFLSGELYRWVGEPSILKLDPAALYRFLVLSDPSLFDWELLHLYLSYTTMGVGEILQPTGQVLYYPNINNLRQAQLLSQIVDTQTNDLERQLFDAKFNEVEWDAFLSLTSRLGRDRIVIVRPPIHAELYALEEAKLGSFIQMAVAEFRNLGVLYIDMNPHNYSVTDHSHVDAFDTKRLSINLAIRIAPHIYSNDIFP